MAAYADFSRALGRPSRPGPAYVGSYSCEASSATPRQERAGLDMELSDISHYPRAKFYHFRYNPDVNNLFFAQMRVKCPNRCLGTRPFVVRYFFEVPVYE